MSFTNHCLPPNPLCLELMTCDYRLMTIFAAVVTAEQAAALVSFRWQQVSLPPTQNVNSAPRSLTSARHFSGKYANYAKNAATTATIATF